MSDSVRTQGEQETEDDCWSDMDESLLAHCAQIENEELGNVTEKHAFSSEREHSTTEGQLTPMEAFSKGDYLCVTDLTQQLWCEQRLCFTLMGVEPPAVAAFDSMSLDDADRLPLPLPTADRPEVKAGKSLHLARELELHDVVDVSVTCKADRWALHVLNLLSCVREFLAGGRVAREIPIFGDPFGRGDLVFGIIDELQFDPETYCVSLTELKTRKTKRLPGKAQKEQHRLQVLLYKQLWDNLVAGSFSADLFVSRLDLQASALRPLGRDVLRHVKATGCSASTLSDLLSQLLDSAQALVRIGSLEVEYVLQDTGSVIGRFMVEEDRDWLEKTYGHCLDFWHGRRRTEGVDIEEAWKCGHCEYSPICQWRIRKSELLCAQNQQQRLGRKRCTDNGDG